MVIMDFYTVHRPRQHSAHRPDGKTIVQPQPTEVDLVRRLKSQGINLERYDYFNNRGEEKFLVVNWRKR